MRLECGDPELGKLRDQGIGSWVWALHTDTICMAYFSCFTVAAYACMTPRKSYA